MSEITVTEVDGVRTLWAPCAAPLRARLVFRVGAADETLVTSGRTHLVEHLALFGLLDPATHHNGAVDLTTTEFTAAGEPDQVAHLLGHVTSALRSLPLHRLEQEKAVLAVEAEQREAWLGEPLLVWRFGALRHGLVALPPYGVRSATGEELQSWAHRWFTRENAVLLLTGPPPAGLRLELPDGMLMPPPAVVSQPYRYPTWFRQDIGGISAGALVPRSHAALVLAALADQLMRERLRVEHAISYSPQVWYQRLDATQAHLTLFADAAAAQLSAVTDAFGPVLHELGEPQPERTAALVATMVAARRRLIDARPEDAALITMASRADDLLHGRPEEETVEKGLAELEATSAEEVAEVGAGFLRGALYALPRAEVETRWYGGAAPASLVEPPAGTAFVHRDDPLVPERLLVGPYGVTIRRSGQVRAAVRYDQLAAALTWADGGITLVGRDATLVEMEPGLWRDGARAARTVLAKVEPSLVVQRGERAPATIPRPASTRAARSAFRARRELRGIGRAALTTVIVLPPALLLAAAVSVVHIPGIPVLVVSLVGGVQLVRMWRADRRDGGTAGRR